MKSNLMVDRTLHAGFPILLIALTFMGCKDEGVVEQPSSTPPPDEGGLLYDVAGIAGSYGKTGDGGPATQARMYWPQDAYIHPASREIYITDWNNHVYRKIALDGTISFSGPVGTGMISKVRGI